jgi:hypothetical protein
MPSPDLRTASGLLAAHRDALIVMPGDSLLAPRVSRERAWELSEIVRVSFAPLVPLLPAELAEPRVVVCTADFAALPDLVVVYYAADLVVAPPAAASPESVELAELKARVRQHDKKLFGWAVPAFAGMTEVERTLAIIRAGRGPRDDADDVIREVELFRMHWGSVSGIPGLTEEYLARAEADALALLERLPRTEEETVEEAPGSPKQFRMRAYTRWARCYRGLVHVGRYVSRDEPDAAARFPLIQPARGERAAAAPPPIPEPGPPAAEPHDLSD